MRRILVALTVVSAVALPVPRASAEPERCYSRFSGAFRVCGGDGHLTVATRFVPMTSIYPITYVECLPQGVRVFEGIYVPPVSNVVPVPSYEIFVPLGGPASTLCAAAGDAFARYGPDEDWPILSGTERDENRAP